MFVFICWTLLKLLVVSLTVLFKRVNINGHCEQEGNPLKCTCLSSSMWETNVYSLSVEVHKSNCTCLFSLSSQKSCLDHDMRFAPTDGHVNIVLIESYRVGCIYTLNAISFGMNAFQLV